MAQQPKDIDFFLLKEPQRKAMKGNTDNKNRKSKAPSSNQSILLQRIVKILSQRSLEVEKVFVSPCSNVKQSVQKRNLNEYVEYFIIKTRSRTCGAGAVNHPGTVTLQPSFFYDKVVQQWVTWAANLKPQPRKTIINEYPKIQKIIVDLYFYENQFKVFNSGQMFNNVKELKLFNCRPGYKNNAANKQLTDFKVAMTTAPWEKSRTSRTSRTSRATRATRTKFRTQLFIFEQQ
ncbi:hypothetical protein BDC45DRAFT_537903 [Circinella umbellata]|nr:hypothetical protein BDC45DRAFT_537903 [Circinella umbellata]